MSSSPLPQACDRSSRYLQRVFEDVEKPPSVKSTDVLPKRIVIDTTHSIHFVAPSVWEGTVAADPHGLSSPSYQIESRPIEHVGPEGDDRLFDYLDWYWRTSAQHPTAKCMPINMHTGFIRPAHHHLTRPRSYRHHDSKHMLYHYSSHHASPTQPQYHCAGFPVPVELVEAQHMAGRP